MSSRRVAGTTVAALALVLAGCGGGATGEGQPPDSEQALKLGYLLPETGPLAYLGPPEIRATEFAVQTINDAGGVLGEPIPDLVDGDEAGDQAIASQSADRLLSEGVHAIMGAASSSMTLAVIDKVTAEGVAMCSAANSAPALTEHDDDGYYFRTNPSDALQGPAIAELIVADGHSRLAVIARQDDYGTGLSKATSDAFEQAGGQVVTEAGYDPNATTFDAVVRKVAASDADAIVVISFEEGKQVLKGLIESSLGPQDVGVYIAGGLVSEKLGELVSPNQPQVVRGLKGVSPAAEVNEDFIAELKEFAPELEETQFAPQAFDCVIVTALAAEAAGSPDAAEFKDAIIDVTRDGQKCTSFEECAGLLADGTDIDYDGPSGPLDFTSDAEPDSANMEIYEWDRQGRMQYVRSQLVHAR